jgi:hypothetical protein
VRQPYQECIEAVDIQDTVVDRRLSEVEGRITALERSLNWWTLFSATALPVVLSIFIAVLGAGWFLTGRLDAQGRRLSGRLEEQGQRLGKLEQQVYNLNERTARVEQQVSDVDQRLTRVEEKVDQVLAALNDLRARPLPQPSVAFR